MKVWQNGMLTKWQTHGMYFCLLSQHLLMTAVLICSYGLPTRSPCVSQFMIGLEKIKSVAGEVSQSACALSLEDMYKLHQLCLETPGLSIGEHNWGVVKHVSRFCYLILFLKTDSHTWRQFISLHGSCCWGLRKLSICCLKALTFIQESVSSLLYSVAWWIVTSSLTLCLCLCRFLFWNKFVHSQVSTDGPYAHLEALWEWHWSTHLSHLCTLTTGKTLWSTLYLHWPIVS